ncbi:MAG: SRPBCC domain-containing protein [Chloroflexi bacterium]|nr:SRPBCC domain-containing protein [Chloroflexota bacterium]
MSEDAGRDYTERHTVRMSRIYPHPVERVWEAITRTEHLGAWMLPVDQIDPRPGGRFSLRSRGPADEGTTGVIAEFRPCVAVEYAFDDGSTLRFELSPVNGGTSLILCHTFPPLQGHGTSTAESGDELPSGRTKPRRPHLDGSGCGQNAHPTGAAARRQTRKRCKQADGNRGEADGRRHRPPDGRASRSFGPRTERSWVELRPCPAQAAGRLLRSGRIRVCRASEQMHTPARVTMS